MYVLVCSSDFNKDHFLRNYHRGVYSAIIAVDGGYAHLKSLGIIPQVAIGDFDSLGYVPQDIAVEVYPTQKDYTDFELALRYVAERARGEEVVVYGALGGRLDHTMGALQASAGYCEKDLAITLVGPDVAAVLLCGTRSSIVFESHDSGILSLFSLSDISAGVTIEGLRYPLDRAILTNREALGLSNEFVGKPACVSLESGCAVAFFPADYFIPRA